MAISFPAMGAAAAQMGPPAVVSAEEVVEYLLRHFVAPLLPCGHVSTPTVDEQRRVGKQMQAVVMLYNYYRRKRSCKLRFMDFRSFCEAACISNSSLVYYMKFMCQGAGSLEDVHGQLSIIEKMVMDACDICASLDASIEVFNMDEWPISKVAVFLVDAAKKKCLLKNDSIILGSWSLIEKELEAPLEKLAGSPETDYGFTNKGLVDESVKLYGIDNFLQEIAYSIVEQDMGITRSNLTILECRLTYSLGQLKSSALLYIMNYKEPPSSGLEVSIEDLIRVQGVPVESSSCDMKLEITPVAEHYCLLPYIDFIAEWASRKTSLGFSLHSLEQKAILKGYSDDHLITANHKMGGKSYLNKDTYNDDFLHSMHQKVDMSGKFYDGDYTESNHQVIGTYNDDLSSPRKNPSCDDSVSKHQSLITKKLIHNGENARNQCNLSPILDGMSSINDQVEYQVKKKCLASSDRNMPESDAAHTGFTNLDKAVVGAQQLVHAHQKSNCYDNQFLALASNKDDLEVLVFQLLKKKRDELCFQQRLLDDFIAQFEMNIQTIISGENLDSQSELIMKARDFLRSSKVTKGANSFVEAQLQPHPIRRRRLFDADLRLRNPCQVLDDICCTNNWILPKYRVFPSPEVGKFQALVTVKGVDFEFTTRGDCEDGPTEARESAVAFMLNKLQDTQLEGKISST